MGIEQIPNIRLQICKFEPQITTFYIQSASLFCFVNNVHGYAEIPQYTNLEKLVKWAQQLHKA